MAKRLLIELDEISKSWNNLNIKCSYPYHFKNSGIVSLREWLAFQIVCRKCEDYPCVHACRYDALERVEETGTNVRNDCLCVSCKSCAVACPFGVIYMEILPFLSFHCDLCEGRLKEKDVPICVETSQSAIKYGDFKEEPDKNIFQAGQVLVKVKPWKKELVSKKGEGQ
ncbi:4Fe-4S ferredoxin [Candidatus Aerophobetes bacterium]|nr:4Fe-4S ferredoxin [Candidatus Aerophobetes bacterium]